MTIQRARQILGNDISGLNDAEVSEFLARTSSFVSALIDIAINDIVVRDNSAPNPLRYEQNSRYIRSSK